MALVQFELRFEGALSSCLYKGLALQNGETLRIHFTPGTVPAHADAEVISQREESWFNENSESVVGTVYTLEVDDILLPPPPPGQVEALCAEQVFGVGCSPGPGGETPGTFIRYDDIQNLTPLEEVIARQNVGIDGAPADGQWLQWDDATTAYVPADIQIADVEGLEEALGEPGGEPEPHTHPFTDIQQSGATGGQVPSWTAGTPGSWIPKTLAPSDISGLQDILDTIIPQSFFGQDVIEIGNQMAWDDFILNGTGDKTKTFLVLVTAKVEASGHVLLPIGEDQENPDKMVLQVVPGAGFDFLNKNAPTGETNGTYVVADPAQQARIVFTCPCIFPECQIFFNYQDGWEVDILIPQASWNATTNAITAPPGYVINSGGAYTVEPAIPGGSIPPQFTPGTLYYSSGANPGGTFSLYTAQSNARVLSGLVDFDAPLNDIILKRNAGASKFNTVAGVSVEFTSGKANVAWWGAARCFSIDHQACISASNAELAGFPSASSAFQAAAGSFRRFTVGTGLSGQTNWGFGGQEGSHVIVPQGLYKLTRRMVFNHQGGCRLIGTSMGPTNLVFDVRDNSFDDPANWDIGDGGTVSTTTRSAGIFIRGDFSGGEISELSISTSADNRNDFATIMIVDAGFVEIAKLHRLVFQGLPERTIWASGNSFNHLGISYTYAIGPRAPGHIFFESIATTTKVFFNHGTIGGPFSLNVDGFNESLYKGRSSYVEIANWHVESTYNVVIIAEGDGDVSLRDNNYSINPWNFLIDENTQVNDAGDYISLNDGTYKSSHFPVDEPVMLVGIEDTVTWTGTQWRTSFEVFDDDRVYFRYLGASVSGLFQGRAYFVSGVTEAGGLYSFDLLTAFGGTPVSPSSGTTFSAYISSRVVPPNGLSDGMIYYIRSVTSVDPDTDYRVQLSHYPGGTVIPLSLNALKDVRCRLIRPPIAVKLSEAAACNVTIQGGAIMNGALSHGLQPSIAFLDAKNKNEAFPMTGDDTFNLNGPTKRPAVALFAKGNSSGDRISIVDL